MQEEGRSSEEKGKNKVLELPQSAVVVFPQGFFCPVVCTVSANHSFLHLPVDQFPTVEEKTLTTVTGEMDTVPRGSDKKVIQTSPSSPEDLASWNNLLTEEERTILAQWKAAEPELTANKSDPFLMRFIWARKLDVERATELLKNHMAWREEHELANLRTAAIAGYFKDGSTQWTPGNYTKQGLPATYIMPRLLDRAQLKTMGMVGMFHASWFVSDMLCDHDIDAARTGPMIFEDFTGCSFGEIMGLMNSSEFDMKKMMDSMQNNLPSRMPGIVIVNAPWYIRILMAISKPMMKKKLLKKVHLCSSDELHKYFTPEQMPDFWGGQFAINTEWTKDVVAHRGDHLSEGRYADPTPRSPELIRQYTGEGEVLHHAEILAASKKKKDKKLKEK